MRKHERRSAAESHAPADSVAQGTFDPDTGNQAQLESAGLAGRFGDQEGNDEANSGTDYVSRGDSGPEVVRIQQALMDLRYALPDYGVDGSFGDETELAVRAFQADATIAVDGVVGPDTLAALTKEFEGDDRYREIAREGPGGEHELAPEERAAIKDALRRDDAPEPTVPFVPEIGGVRYEEALQNAAMRKIDEQFADVTRDAAARADPANLHAKSAIEGVGLEASGAVDQVFGGYATGPLPPIEDHWTLTERRLKNDVYADIIVQNRLDAVFRSRAVLEVDTAYHAQPRGTAEAPLRQTLREALTLPVASGGRREHLEEIAKGVKGAEGAGVIGVQLLAADTDEGCRLQMCEYFQTLVHEYLHSLQHADLDLYVQKLKQENRAWEANVLKEGLTELLARIAWSGVVATTPLRVAVEGEFYDPTEPAIPEWEPSYASAADAEQLMGVVGAPNVYAAYFLGRIDLVGAP